MNTWKVILATVVIFGAGVITGGLLVRHSNRALAHSLRPAPDTTRATPTFSPSGMRLEFLRRAERELNLTPEQREQVDKIIKESQERTRKIMEPVTPEMRAELRRTKEQFREVLTPEQQARFDALVKRPKDQRRQFPFRERSAQTPAATNAP